ncbi:MAG: hypothetical protein QOE61_5689, partial [Micromonosporaceae bacterium]|nr:hypothetical protein [Micromonosporaceae bacterium]
IAVYCPARELPIVLVGGLDAEDPPRGVGEQNRGTHPLSRKRRHVVAHRCTHPSRLTERDNGNCRFHSLSDPECPHKVERLVAPYAYPVRTSGPMRLCYTQAGATCVGFGFASADCRARTSDNWRGQLGEAVPARAGRLRALVATCQSLGWVAAGRSGVEGRTNRCCAVPSVLAAVAVEAGEPGSLSSTGVVSWPVGWSTRASRSGCARFVNSADCP